MRSLTVAALGVLVLAAPARAQTDAELMAPIKKFVESTNKGDAAGAAATLASGADLTIIDEVPPYLWQGPKTLQTWVADLETDAKKTGTTEPMVALSAPSRIEKNVDSAYVIIPSVITFKSKGAAMRGAGQMTFVLRKGSSGWLIHGWTWTGARPQPASPK